MTSSTPQSSPTYQPSEEILAKYAQVLVNFALNSGQGLKKGEVVRINVPDIAKPLAKHLRDTVLKAGGYPMLELSPTGMSRDFYELASDDQLTFFPEKYLKARAELVDHQISIIADPFPFELKGLDPQKFIKARDAAKPYVDWLNAKENQDKFTWTLGLWGTQAKADIVGLSLEEYWQQIIKACFLDQPDPIKEWQHIFEMQKSIKQALNDKKITQVHIKGEDADLTIGIGEDRIWEGGSGRNIPSFEFFTSPNNHQAEGWIKFNQPLYRYGNMIKDVRLEFKAGQVVKAEAKEGNEFLQGLLKSPGADRLGEFSLTDKRTSRITHVMAETLYDENIGGPYGNTHLAVGRAYQTCYRGDPTQLTREEWAEIGFNSSAEHTDIVSTTNRTVTATLADGSTEVIYENGMFTCYEE